MVWASFAVGAVKFFLLADRFAFTPVKANFLLPMLLTALLFLDLLTRLWNEYCLGVLTFAFVSLSPRHPVLSPVFREYLFKKLSVKELSVKKFSVKKLSVKAFLQQMQFLPERSPYASK